MDYGIHRQAALMRKGLFEQVILIFYRTIFPIEWDRIGFQIVALFFFSVLLYFEIGCGFQFFVYSNHLVASEKKSFSFMRLGMTRSTFNWLTIAWVVNCQRRDIWTSSLFSWRSSRMMPIPTLLKKLWPFSSRTRPDSSSILRLLCIYAFSS